MVLQIVRPDIVITLPEFNPARALEQADPIARLKQVKEDESRKDTGEGASTPTHLDATETYQGVAHPESIPQPALAVSQIMTTPSLTLELGASIIQARRLFREHGFRHLPLTTTDGRITGILSERDMLRHAAASAQRRASIADFATREVLTATEETEIRTIAAIMLERRVGCIPIVDKDGISIGIVTRADILRALLRRAPLELWI